MSAAAFKRAAAVFSDESGEGFADYSIVIGLFALQLVCGAIALNGHIDHIIHSIHAVFA